MKQAFLLKGKVITREISQPLVRPGYILIKTEYSCISAGTELSSLRVSKRNILIQAIQKPRLVFIFLRIGLNRGIRFMINSLISAIGSEFGSNIGYSAVGIVKQVGKDVKGFNIGQRVAVVGTNYANHAEYNCVPINLTIAVPECKPIYSAATAALGGIALQGIRQLQPNPGDTVVVMGLGFIGQLTVQLLKNSGCKVIGIDINNNRLIIAQKSYEIGTINGNDPLMVEKVLMMNNGDGVDGVIFTAATQSSEPMSACFKVLRKKGKFILVGVSGMQINRADIYSKEIDIKIATSYGPGRYDRLYEEKGIDYPYEYVRFTEKRNIQNYLEMLANGRISIEPLSLQIYGIDEASKAYQILQHPDPPMLSLLSYNFEEDKNYESKYILRKKQLKSENVIEYALIGAGSYVKGMHLPLLANMKAKFRLKAVMSRSAVPAAGLANQYHAEYYTTNINDILNDRDIKMVMVCTHHDSHAQYAIQSLRAGKDVFVEKPLALNEDELNEIIKTITETNQLLLVGYNRRFSKYIKEIKRWVDKRKTPLFLEYTMNAGYIPYDHWVHDASGGGRVIGEMCHIIDLAQFLIGSKIKKITTNKLKFLKNYYHSEDNVTTTLSFDDGSIAVIHYFSIGSKALQKESMCVCFDGKKIFLNDYTSISSDFTHVRKIKTIDQDKGQKDILDAWYEALKNRVNPIPLEDIKQTTLVTLNIDRF